MSAGIRLFEPGTKALSPKAYQRAFQRLDTGAAIIGSGGQIIAANPSFRQLFGTRAGAPLQRSLLFLQMLDLPPTSLPAFLSSMGDAPSFGEARCQTPQGEPLFLGYHLKRIQRGTFLCEIKDLTQKRRRAPRTEMVEARLLEAGEYAHRVTHALKGSLTALAYTVETLRTQPERLHELLDSLSALRRRMSETVHLVLKGTMERERHYSKIDLRFLIEEIVNLPEIQIKASKGTISIEIIGPPMTIEIERDQLREALIYLLENAIEAILEKTDPHGRIQIAIKSNPSAEPEEARIEIHDEGVGIPPEHLNRAFAPFFSTKKGGSGIGLTIARRIVTEVHGGSIAVTSQVGCGTTFSVSLPSRPQTPLILDENRDVPEKMQTVRRQLASAGKNYPEFMEEIIATMTVEHLRESSASELAAQIQGQVDRLESFLSSGLPHLSVNNLSRYTEVVLACPKDSAGRTHWEDLIRYELQKMGLGDTTSVVGTRQARKEGAVCKIFEIKKMRGKLSEEERASLEATLQEKFTLLPSLEELQLQATFLSTARGILQRYGIGSSAHSLLYRPSQVGPLRLVGYQLAFFPEGLFGIEESVIRKLVLEQPTPFETLAFLIALSEEAPSSPLIINESLTPQALERFRIGGFLARLVAAFNIQSVLAAIFSRPSGETVINLICSESRDLFPPFLEHSFQQANLAWLSSAKKI